MAFFSGCRGQVLFFVILSFLLLSAVFFGFFFFLPDQAESTLDSPMVLKSVRLFVEDCLGSVLREGVSHIALRGGYNVLPDSSTLDAAVNAPFYLGSGQFLIPSLDRVQQELSSYLLEGLGSCLANFSSFTEEIVSGSPSVAAIISEGRVTARLVLPLQVRREDSFLSLNDFGASTPSPFLNLYKTGMEVVEVSARYQGVCLNCVEEVAARRGVQVSVIKLNDGELVYVLGEDGLLFRFAVTYG